MILFALAAAAAAASTDFSATYDCVLEAPKALKEEGSTASLNAINFPGVAEGAWKFQTMVRRDKGGLNVEVIWPENPIQLAGKFAGLPTADGSIAFAAYSMGPCMFTESACMSLVSLVEKGDGSAKMIITPAALATDEKANARDPFVVVIKGTCTRTGASK